MIPVCDIVVLTYNKLEVTREFFRSLGLTDLPIRVIVIDNASSDGTKDYLETLENSTNCIFDIVYNAENVGFVRGMNQGIALSEAAYVCMANSDLIFTKNWLNEIIGLFEKHQAIGILNPNSNTLGAKPVNGQTVEDLASSLQQKYSGKFSEMPFCSGFCMVVRREVLNAIGGLSEEYVPMFFEDTDFSLKASKEGYLIGVSKASYVWHKEHGSFKNKSRYFERIFKKNKAIFEAKWGGVSRIAWIARSYDELLSALPQGAEFARKGNFLTFYTRKLDINREEIFQAAGLFEHSGIKFKSFKNYFILFLEFLFKKKKYHSVVTKSGVIKFLFKNLVGDNPILESDLKKMVYGRQ